MRRPWSLKWFLIVSITLAVTIPVIIIGVIMIKISIDSLKKEIAFRNNLLSRVLVSQTEEYLKKPLEDLISLKTLIEKNKMKGHLVDVLLDNADKRHGYFIKLQIIDKKGFVKNVSPYDEEFIDIDMSRRPFFIETQRTGRVYWSSTFISPQLNIPVVTVSVPIKDGVITGYLSLSKLIETVNKIVVGGNSFITITDQTGTFISHYDQTKVYQREHDDNYALFKKDFHGNIMTKTVSYKDQTMMCLVDFIRSTGWAVVIYQSVQDLFAPVKHLYFILGVGILLIIIITTSLSIRYVNSIIGILNKFINTTSVISAGSYDTVVEETKYDEFSKLAQHFNSMVESIKNREEIINKSEKRFRTVIETAREGIWVIDTKARTTFANRQLADMLGYTIQEMNGMKVQEFLDENNAAIFEEKLRKRKKELRAQYDLRFCCKDGSELWGIVNAAPLFDADGNVVGSFGMITDVTERKLAEENLRKERERLSTVLDGNPILIFMIDKDHHVGFWNRSLETLTSIYRKDVLGKTLGESLGPVYPDKVPPILADLILDMTDEELLKHYGHKIRKADFGESFEVTTSIWPGGEKRILEVIATRIRDSEGKVVGAIQCAQDVTDREKLQNQLMQAQKIQAIGTLAGGIAHDFNNILSSIIGYAELALDNTKKGTLLHEHLQEVLTAGNRAADLVKRILTFSRRTDQEQKPVQVKSVTKEALKLLRAFIPSTIEIQQNLKSTALVMGDSTQIHQVLMNLGTNAAHAMKDKEGVLTVNLLDAELDSVFVSNHPELIPGPYVNLTVTDTGHGMAPDVLEKIFDPFFTTKKKGEGTGMGLSVVHGIVHGHKGTIYCYSKPGGGTTFKVLLPAVERSLTPKERSEKPIPSGTERILFVDDEPAIVNVGKQILESLGYETTTMTNSIEALERFRAQPDVFDIVVTDMTMPNMTGDNLAKELMQIRPNIPVILCSGFSTRIDEKKAMAMGIRAFISKPILKRDIAEIIRNVLDG